MDYVGIAYAVDTITLHGAGLKLALQTNNLRTETTSSKPAKCAAKCDGSFCVVPLYRIVVRLWKSEMRDMRPGDDTGQTPDLFRWASE
jgi:hypothetical protein